MLFLGVDELGLHILLKYVLGGLYVGNLMIQEKYSNAEVLLKLL